MNTQSMILVAIALTALFSSVGAIFLYMTEKDFEKVIPYLVSLSAGSMFGGVFIHLAFRLVNKYEYGRFTGLLVVAGLVGSFLLEKIVHWHCHHSGRHDESLPYVLAVGDSVHNVLDGIVIATGFLASSSAGIAATVAIIAHKIPKELGDFGVMVKGGFSRYKALGVNIGVGAFMFLGALSVIGVAEFFSPVQYLLPLVIGNFVFIAGSDLLPELKDEKNWVRHILIFSLGVAIMYSVPYIKALV